jgi:catalase
VGGFLQSRREDYFEQAGDLFRLLPDDEKDRLAATTASGLCQAEESVQERMLGYFSNADADYARRVRQAMT